MEFLNNLMIFMYKFSGADAGAVLIGPLFRKSFVLEITPMLFLFPALIIFLISSVLTVVMANLGSQTGYKWQPASHLVSRRRGSVSAEQEDTRVCIEARGKCYGNASLLIQKRFFR